MKPYGLSMNRLAADLHVPVTRIAEIVNERRGITSDTALRLARYFRTTPQFWLNMQLHYECRLPKVSWGRRSNAMFSRWSLLRAETGSKSLQPQGINSLR